MTAPPPAREKKSASDMPLDLAKERESFVRSFLQKGVEYTETLLDENGGLREEIASLRSENARLRAQIASDDAIRDLLRTVEKLEEERSQLLQQSSELEERRLEHEGRHREAEQEVNDLANLYIASCQLGGSLSMRRVVRHLRDMCGQLVGAEGFVIYAVDPRDNAAHPIAYEQLDGERLAPVAMGEGAVGEACLTGVMRIRDDGGDHGPFIEGTHDDPVAVIPLMADGRAVGAISVITLLEQKKKWANVDRELFQLLGAQGGTALIAANLYSQAKGPIEALKGLRDHVENVAEPPLASAFGNEP